MNTDSSDDFSLCPHRVNDILSSEVTYTPGKFGADVGHPTIASADLFFSTLAKLRNSEQKIGINMSIKNCPYCNAPAHASKKKTWVCGTWVTTTSIYQSDACKLVAESNLRVEAANDERDTAIERSKAAEVVANVALEKRDKALEQAKKDREYCLQYRMVVADKMRAFYSRFLSGMRDSMDAIVDNEMQALDHELEQSK